MDPPDPDSQIQSCHPRLRKTLYLRVLIGDPTGNFKRKHSPLRALNFQSQPSPLRMFWLANTLPDPVPIEATAAPVGKLAHRLKTGIHPLCRADFVGSFNHVLNFGAAGQGAIQIAPHGHLCSLELSDSLFWDRVRRRMLGRALPRAVFTEWMHELLDELESKDSDFKKVVKEIRELLAEQGALRNITEDMGELLQVRQEVRGVGR